ncbi:MAG TPA: FumA C-terminus/TtdB family hydratase beta subunit [Lentisphaeria bacterium]|nr:FumA C-terminus/TtdB family hydratase beta subunit [Lentisphaeria bacterium]
MKKLTMPLTEDCVRSLTLGESVSLNGTIYTARDAVHHRLATGNGPLPTGLDLRSAVLYHCGPVVVKTNGSWRVTAAGPTTSTREEPYMADIIRMYGIKGIIGKGGMGQKTAAACREYGCVYLHAVGGAAQVLADSIVEVSDVFFLEEFGAPEAIWVMQVKNFPAIVTMDAAGQSLHAKVQTESRQKLEKLVDSGQRTLGDVSRR